MRVAKIAGNEHDDALRALVSAQPGFPCPGLAMNATRFLSISEVLRIVASLKRRASNPRLRTSAAKANLIIIRLTCGAGLRVSELCGIKMSDVVVSGPRPAIRVRRDNTKGKKRSRVVPLWWDQGTLADIQAWKLFREREGAGPEDPFVPAKKDSRNGMLNRNGAAGRFKTAIKVLGPDRVAQLSIHCGRHSFCSHAIRAGRSIVEVRDAAGHKSIEITCVYLHSIESNAKNLYGDA